MLATKERKELKNYANCAACHSGSGNIVRWSKNLKLRTLNMSAYKDRLTEEEIKNVSAYVLQQAQNN